MRAAFVFFVSVGAYRSEGSLHTFQNHTFGNYNWLLDSVVQQALYDNRNVAEFRRDYDVPLCVCCVIRARVCAWPFVAMWLVETEILLLSKSNILYDNRRANRGENDS